MKVIIGNTGFNKWPMCTRCHWIWKPPITFPRIFVGDICPECGFPVKHEIGRWHWREERSWFNLKRKYIEFEFRDKYKG